MPSVQSKLINSDDANVLWNWPEQMRFQALQEIYQPCVDLLGYI